MLEYKYYDKLNIYIKFIRETVFVNEQGFSEEFDDIDNRCLFVVIFNNEKPVATGRLFKEDNTNEFIIGRVAVLEDYRNKNYGAKVISLLEAKAKQLGAKQISLSAQLRAEHFYQKQGYISSGDTYFDEFCEHIHMKKIF